jgi:hypothetical protein
MPYKNPEHKRQWEREHREQRNAQRRQRRFETQRNLVVHQQLPAAVPAKDSASGWKTLLGLAIGMGVILLRAVAGVDTASTGRTQ